MVGNLLISSRRRAGCFAKNDVDSPAFPAALKPARLRVGSTDPASPVPTRGAFSHVQQAKRLRRVEEDLLQSTNCSSHSALLVPPHLLSSSAQDRFQDGIVIPFTVDPSNWGLYFSEVARSFHEKSTPLQFFKDEFYLQWRSKPAQKSGFFNQKIRSFGVRASKHLSCLDLLLRPRHFVSCAS